ncbi:Concanavalin A-like lectin/glucanases superfamily protein [Prosthecobacter debontii]|uniref:Concanavalin A-like lectin/glucanases superfamily protein n=1 Tax=Prosthecobacter debontii TaxID=48467 RepID=A0A1T4Y073_9BACT|nr:LamG domain-containing protein [Prosthecobacter debontii]SKA95199.1 Concanavalin A-like lectin/glucanases superfamily protein [Prosthecobacter debontii]
MNFYKDFGLVFRVLLIAAGCICGQVEAGAQSPVKWVDLQGREIMAEFVSINGGDITLRMNGKLVTFPLGTLSVESKQQAIALNLVASSVGAEPVSGMNDRIARFTFDEATPHRDAVLKNAKQSGGLLELNGIYEFSNEPDAYRAVLACPQLIRDQFTVAVRVTVDRLGDCVLAGGTSHRWLALQTDEKGALSLSLNNGAVRLESKKGGQLKRGKVADLAITHNVVDHSLTLYLNGEEVQKHVLASDFQFKPISKPGEPAGDSVFTFTNYSSGSAMKGEVDELIVYNRVLTPREIRDLKLGVRALNE